MKQSQLTNATDGMLTKLLAAAALFICGILGCTRCPESEYGDLAERVPSPATKNDGVDLEGWTYEQAVSSQNNETHYYYRFSADDPKKPTFVFLHGLLFDGKNFIHFKPLAKHFNLIALDLPNKSSFYTGKFDDFATLLSDFLQSMHLEKVYLGGVSLGGQIAMIYASVPRPVPLQGLLLISTDIAKNEKELKSAIRLAKTTGRITNRTSEKTLCVVTKLVDKKKAEAKGKLSSLDNFVLRNVEFYNQVLDTSIEMKHPIALKDIAVPTLIFHGDKDSVISIKDAKGLPDYIPNAKFVTLKDAEHTAAYTHATEIIRLVEERFTAEN